MINTSSRNALLARWFLALSNYPELLQQPITEEMIEHAILILLDEHPELAESMDGSVLKPSDNVALFIHEMCTVDEDATVKADDLYRAYVDWCAKGRRVPVSKVHFGRVLRKRVQGLQLYKPWRGDRGPGEGRKQWYRGIGLA